MLKPEYTNQFKKDLKLLKKRNYNTDKLWNIINDLVNEKTLPPKNREHNLIGDYIGYKECHIGPDWLLLYYYQIGDYIIFARTGTHSDIFN